MHNYSVRILVVILPRVQSLYYLVTIQSVVNFALLWSLQTADEFRCWGVVSSAIRLLLGIGTLDSPMYPSFLRIFHTHSLGHRGGMGGRMFGVVGHTLGARDL